MSVTTFVRAMTSLQTSTISRLIQYAYFERFPILIAALLVLFPFGASHFAPTMLSGMLTLESQKQVFVTAWLAFQTAWTAMLCWRIILINGYQRFSIKPLQLRPSSSNTSVLCRWFTYFLFWPLLALPILYEVIKNSPGQRPILMTFFGFLGAWALMYVGSLTENWLFSTPAPDETPPREFRALAVPFNDRLQERARKSPSWLHDRVAGVLQSFPAKISDGM